MSHRSGDIERGLARVKPLPRHGLAPTAVDSGLPSLQRRQRRGGPGAFGDSRMSLDRIIAQTLATAISEGRIPATEGVPGSCHAFRHVPTCPMRLTRGQDDRCTCGDDLRITLHPGELADCSDCARREHAH